MRTSRASGAVLLLWMLVAALSGCNSNNHQILSQILLVQGSVRATATSGDALHPLHRADTLAAGNRISVGPGGIAGLSLTPGALALLDQQTELTLDQLAMQKRGASVELRFAGVTLRGGTARFSVGAPPDRRTEALAVVAAGAGRLIAEPGTVFGVTIRSPQTARVTCAKGSVHWISQAGPPAGWVRAGQFTDFGSLETDGSRREAIGDAAASQEIAALLAVGVRLNALQEVQRSLTPFRP